MSDQSVKVSKKSGLTKLVLICRNEKVSAKVERKAKMYIPKVLLQDTYYPFGYILKPSRALLCAVLFVKVDIG